MKQKQYLGVSTHPRVCGFASKNIYKNNDLQNKQSTDRIYDDATNNVVNQQIMQDSANSGLAN